MNRAWHDAGIYQRIPGVRGVAWTPNGVIYGEVLENVDPPLAHGPDTVRRLRSEIQNLQRTVVELGRRNEDLAQAAASR